MARLRNRTGTVVRVADDAADRLVREGWERLDAAPGPPPAEPAKKAPAKRARRKPASGGGGGGDDAG